MNFTRDFAFLRYFRSLTEMMIVSDRFDMALSLLLLENTHSGAELEEDVDEDVFDRIERSQNRGLAP